MPMISVLRGIFGVTIFLLICVALSADRKKINRRLVARGLLLQFAIAVMVLKVPWVTTGLEAASRFFIQVLAFSTEGAEFAFGTLVSDTTIGAVWAFQVLPSVIFLSALASVLFYLGLLQKIVYAFAWVMHRTMELSGAESLAVAANVFIGQSEAPLVIRPYLERMTRSEISCLMTGGMATIAGSVLVAYIAILGGADPVLQVEVGRRLIAASIMAAPAAVVFAKILVPETEQIDRDLNVPRETIGVNVFDALVVGTTQGIRLAVNIGGIVIVFIALAAMLNYMTTHWIGSWSGLNETIAASTDGAFEGLTLQFVFGVLFAPVAWLTGVDGGSLLFVGQLFGEKLVLNEFVAYISMSEMIAAGHLTDPKAIVISTFALCGFASFVSIGIQIGGIGALAPGQRENLAKLALRALLGGTCATLVTATIAGMFFG